MSRKEDLQRYQERKAKQQAQAALQANTDRATKEAALSEILDSFGAGALLKDVRDGLWEIGDVESSPSKTSISLKASWPYYVPGKSEEDYWDYGPKEDSIGHHIVIPGIPSKVSPRFVSIEISADFTWRSTLMERLWRRRYNYSEVDKSIVKLLAREGDKHHSNSDKYVRLEIRCQDSLPTLERKGIGEVYDEVRGVYYKKSHYVT